MFAYSKNKSLKIMKKINLLFLVLLVIISSCSKDDGPSEITGDILGQWNLTAYDYDGKSVTTAAGVSITSEFIGEGLNFDATVTFSDNPNTIVSQGDYTLRLTTTVMGETNVVEHTFSDFIGNGNWEQSGNKLSVSSGDLEYDYTIKRLTDNELILSLETVEDLSEQGFTIITTINAEMVLTR